VSRAPQLRRAGHRRSDRRSTPGRASTRARSSRRRRASALHGPNHPKRAARSGRDAPTARRVDATDIGPKHPARYGQNDCEIAAAGITVSCRVGDHVFHVGLFVGGSRASSRSAIGCLIVSGKKPFDFCELAINFASFQPNHRQHHNDGGQSHRESNQYTQPLSPQSAADIKSGRSWAAPPSAPGSASRPTVRPTSAEGRDPAGGTARQSNRARQYPRTQGLFMVELGKGEGLRRRTAIR